MEGGVEDREEALLELKGDNILIKEVGKALPHLLLISVFINLRVHALLLHHLPLLLHLQQPRNLVSPPLLNLAHHIRCELSVGLPALLGVVDQVVVILEGPVEVCGEFLGCFSSFLDKFAIDVSFGPDFRFLIIILLDELPHLPLLDFPFLKRLLLRPSEHRHLLFILIQELF